MCGRAPQEENEEKKLKGQCSALTNVKVIRTMFIYNPQLHVIMYICVCLSTALHVRFVHEQC